VNNITSTPPSLGKLSGAPGHVYWRHYAYSLPYRVQHNLTNTFFNSTELLNEEKIHLNNKIQLRYGIQSALNSSIALGLSNTIQNKKGINKVYDLSLAMTTCKRLRYFLPTFNALKAVRIFKITANLYLADNDVQ
jgi:hypothetical protein